MPPIAKGIYGRAYRSINNKDKHTCNVCIVKSTNGSIKNRGIQSNQDVHVYGIWWIGEFVVLVANFYFYFCSLRINLSFDLGTFHGKNMGYLYYLFLFREAGI